jgi:hypothetical protein
LIKLSEYKYLPFFNTYCKSSYVWKNENKYTEYKIMHDIILLFKIFEDNEEIRYTIEEMYPKLRKIYDKYSNKYIYNFIKYETEKILINDEFKKFSNYSFGTIKNKKHLNNNNLSSFYNIVE